MIARTWRGLTRESDKEVYFEYLKKTGLPGYAATKGNRGVSVLCRVRDGVAEFLLISLWDSYESIRAFAGPDFEKAVYYPEDKKFLLELEPNVSHYEVLSAPGVQPDQTS
jgi:heme-degrading monooxygenase HmoA